MRFPTKNEWKDRLYTALMVAPTLSVMLMSAIFSLATGAIGTGDHTMNVVLGVLSVLAIIASAVLSYVWEKRLPAALLCVILWLCFFSYLAVTVSGTSDFLDDAFFQALTLVFSLPVFSYGAVVGRYAVGILILTALLASLHTGVLVMIGLRRKKENRRG